MRREEEFAPRRRSPHLDGVKEIDLNNSEFLRQFMTEHGKIVPSRFAAPERCASRARRPAMAEAKKFPEARQSAKETGAKDDDYVYGSIVDGGCG